MLAGVRPTSRPKVIRDPSWFLLPLVLLAWAIAATVRPEFPWPSPLVRVPFVAVLLLLVGRAVRIGVVFDDEGVTLRSLLRAWRWPWAEVRGFERRGVVFVSVRAVLCLKSGDCHHVAALMPLGKSPGTVRRFDRLLDSLNEEITRRAASAQPQPPSGA